MAGVPVGEQSLVVGFEAVVELLDEPGAQLVHEWSAFETREEQCERPEHHIGVHEVGADRVVDAGILDLHRDPEPRLGDRSMHLPDRRGRDGLRIPLREQPLRSRAELLAHDLRAELGCHRRRVLLQCGECFPHRLRKAVVEIARHLPELHQGALELPERARDVGRGADLVGGVELGPALGRRRGAPGRVDRLAGSGACADGRQPAVARHDGVAHERGTTPRAHPGRDDGSYRCRDDGCAGSGSHVATVAVGRYT